jgi:ABC-2 type transport system ATP-binding protein
MVISSDYRIADWPCPMKNNDRTGNVVEAQDLTKVVGEDVAVQSLNMQVPRGTIFGFVGPSGCGKTTVRLLTGIYKPTSGTLSVLGKTPSDFSKSDREKIGYLIQQFVLYPDLTVWENLNFAVSFYGVGIFRHKRLNKLLDFVELSGGQTQIGKESLWRDKETSRSRCHAGARPGITFSR